MIENFWLNALYSVTPTILIGLVFWFVMRAILRADRRERTAYAEIEREERRKRGLPVDQNQPEDLTTEAPASESPTAGLTPRQNSE